MTYIGIILDEKGIYFIEKLVSVMDLRVGDYYIASPDDKDHMPIISKNVVFIYKITWCHAVLYINDIPYDNNFGYTRYKLIPLNVYMEETL